MKYPSLPLQYLSSFVHLNDIVVNGIEIVSSVTGTTSDGVEFQKGSGIIATTAHEEQDVLLRVPAGLQLSLEAVKDFKRLDAEFFRIWDAVASFEEGSEETRTSEKRKGSTWIETPRGAILLFLAYQFTKASVKPTDQSTQTGEAAVGSANPHSPGTSKSVGKGVPTPWFDYINFLPKSISLPTFYSDEERELVAGTSLADALDQKLLSLQSEYDMVCDATGNIDWCQQYWWNAKQEDGTDAQLTLDDWKLMDAIYRSRALELPGGVGAAMVPVLDMANHASGQQWNARFEVQERSASGDKDIVLVVREGHKVTAGQEVTINYGAGGACELLFSYGFLEDGLANARELFLSLRMPLDDPLRVAKIRFSSEAPGVRIFEDENGTIGWESLFVWWACVNEEDGLDFRIIQSIDGQRDLQAVWKGREFKAPELKSILMEDELRDIFVLRATVLIQQRLEEQGENLADLTDEELEAKRLQWQVRDTVWTDMKQLRRLELDLLSRAYESLDAEKATLLSSEIVSRYLSNGADSTNRGEAGEDFS